MTQDIRHTSPVAKRVLIVGLDGATFDVFKPLMAAGKMPNLAAICKDGAHGTLYSTQPPITPAAWTTFMTGKGPGRHGIIDFERYDVHANELRFNSMADVREATIWKILSDKGLKVGSINVPMTYPPKPVNGFVIAGFDAPTEDVNFTYPPDLKQALYDHIPDYSHAKQWKRKALGGEDIFADNLAYISKSFKQGEHIVEFCGQRYGWDVMMVLFKLVDNLQHKVWRYIGEQGRKRDPQRAAMVEECWASLDKTIGWLANYARKHDAMLLIMSDHGHGALEGKIQPNLLLRQWGYLKLRDPWTRFRTRGGRIINRLLGRPTGRGTLKIPKLEQELAIDFARTRACVMHAGMCGFVYLNLKGRQPGGIVEPRDYESLRDEIRAKLLSVESVGPDGQKRRAFAEVHKPEQFYNCSRDDQQWMPDLLLVPSPGLTVVRKIRGHARVHWIPPDRQDGTHRIEGILAAAGGGVCTGAAVDGQMVDILPTVLAALGLPLPSDLEGRVLAELFDQPLDVQHETAAAHQFAEPTAAAYTEQEQRLLTERLTDLGYLE